MKKFLYLALFGIFAFVFISIFIFIPAAVSASQNFDYKINNDGHFWSETTEIDLIDGDTLTFLSASSPRDLTLISMNNDENVYIVGRKDVEYTNLVIYSWRKSLMEEDASLTITDLKIVTPRDILVISPSNGLFTLKLNGENYFAVFTPDENFASYEGNCIDSFESMRIVGPGSLKLAATGKNTPWGIYCKGVGGIEITDGATLTINAKHGVFFDEISIRGGANYIYTEADGIEDGTGLMADKIIINANAGDVYIRTKNGGGAAVLKDSYIQTGNIEDIHYADNAFPVIPLQRIKVTGNPTFRAGDVVEVRVPAGNGFGEYIYRSPIVNTSFDSSAYLWLPEGEYEFTANGYASARARVTQNEDSLTLSGTTRGAQTEFNDVSPSDWFYNAVNYVAQRGIFGGNANGDFKPNAEMTRASVTMALAALHGADVSGYKSSSFTDIKNDKPYMPYVEWAKANGIIFGVTATLFEPDRTVKREEIAAIFLRYADFAKKNTQVVRKYSQFADYDKISHYAKYAAEVLQNSDVITGRPGNIFDPAAIVTRAETAQMLLMFDNMN